MAYKGIVQDIYLIADKAKEPLDDAQRRKRERFQDAISILKLGQAMKSGELSRERLEQRKLEQAFREGAGERELGQIRKRGELYKKIREEEHGARRARAVDIARATTKARHAAAEPWRFKPTRKDLQEIEEHGQESIAETDREIAGRIEAEQAAEDLWSGRAKESEDYWERFRRSLEDREAPSVGAEISVPRSSLPLGAVSAAPTGASGSLLGQRPSLADALAILRGGLTGAAATSGPASLSSMGDMAMSAAGAMPSVEDVTGKRVTDHYRDEARGITEDIYRRLDEVIPEGTAPEAVNLIASGIVKTAYEVFGELPPALIDAVEAKGADIEGVVDLVSSVPNIGDLGLGAGGMLYGMGAKFVEDIARLAGAGTAGGLGAMTEEIRPTEGGVSPLNLLAAPALARGIADVRARVPPTTALTRQAGGQQVFPGAELRAGRGAGGGLSDDALEAMARQATARQGPHPLTGKPWTKSDVAAVIREGGVPLEQMQLDPTKLRAPMGLPAPEAPPAPAGGFAPPVGPQALAPELIAPQLTPRAPAAALSQAPTEIGGRPTGVFAGEVDPYAQAEAMLADPTLPPPRDPLPYSSVRPEPVHALPPGEAVDTGGMGVFPGVRPHTVYPGREPVRGRFDLNEGLPGHVIPRRPLPPGIAESTMTEEPGLFEPSYPLPRGLQMRLGTPGKKYIEEILGDPRYLARLGTPYFENVARKYGFDSVSHALQVAIRAQERGRPVDMVAVVERPLQNLERLLKGLWEARAVDPDVVVERGARSTFRHGGGGAAPKMDEPFEQMPVMGDRTARHGVGLVREVGPAGGSGYTLPEEMLDAELSRLSGYSYSQVRPALVKLRDKGDLEAHKMLSVEVPGLDTSDATDLAKRMIRKVFEARAVDPDIVVEPGARRASFEARTRTPRGVSSSIGAPSDTLELPRDNVRSLSPGDVELIRRSAGLPDKDPLGITRETSRPRRASVPMGAEWRVAELAREALRMRYGIDPDEAISRLNIMSSRGDRVATDALLGLDPLDPSDLVSEDPFDLAEDAAKALSPNRRLYDAGIAGEIPGARAGRRPAEQMLELGPRQASGQLPAHPQFTPEVGPSPGVQPDLGRFVNYGGKRIQVDAPEPIIETGVPQLGEGGLASYGGYETSLRRHRPEIGSFTSPHPSVPTGVAGIPTGIADMPMHGSDPLYRDIILEGEMSRSPSAPGLPEIGPAVSDLGERIHAGDYAAAPAGKAHSPLHSAIATRAAERIDAKHGPGTAKEVDTLIERSRGRVPEVDRLVDEAMGLTDWSRMNIRQGEDIRGTGALYGDPGVTDRINALYESAARAVLERRRLGGRKPSPFPDLARRLFREETAAGEVTKPLDAILERLRLKKAINSDSPDWVQDPNSIVANISSPRELVNAGMPAKMVRQVNKVAGKWNAADLVQNELLGKFNQEVLPRMPDKAKRIEHGKLSHKYRKLWYDGIKAIEKATPATVLKALKGNVKNTPQAKALLDDLQSRFNAELREKGIEDYEAAWRAHDDAMLQNLDPHKRIERAPFHFPMRPKQIRFFQLQPARSVRRWTEENRHQYHPEGGYLAEHDIVNLIEPYHYEFTHRGGPLSDDIKALEKMVDAMSDTRLGMLKQALRSAIDEHIVGGHRFAVDPQRWGPPKIAKSIWALLSGTFGLSPVNAANIWELSRLNDKARMKYFSMIDEGLADKNYGGDPTRVPGFYGAQKSMWKAAENLQKALEKDHLAEAIFMFVGNSPAHTLGRSMLDSFYAGALGGRVVAHGIVLPGADQIMTSTVLGGTLPEYVRNPGTFLKMGAEGLKTYSREFFNLLRSRAGFDVGDLQAGIKALVGEADLPHADVFSDPLEQVGPLVDRPHRKVGPKKAETLLGAAVETGQRAFKGAKIAFTSPIQAQETLLARTSILEADAKFRRLWEEFGGKEMTDFDAFVSSLSPLLKAYRGQMESIKRLLLEGNWNAARNEFAQWFAESRFIGMGPLDKPVATTKIKAAARATGTGTLGAFSEWLGDIATAFTNPLSKRTSQGIRSVASRDPELWLNMGASLTAMTMLTAYLYSVLAEKIEGRKIEIPDPRTSTVDEFFANEAIQRAISFGFGEILRDFISDHKPHGAKSPFDFFARFVKKGARLPVVTEYNALMDVLGGKWKRLWKKTPATAGEGPLPKVTAEDIIPWGKPEKKGRRRRRRRGRRPEISPFTPLELKRVRDL